MKRNVLNLGFGLLAFLVFFSCLKDEDDIVVSYGVIQNVISPSNYEILTDKGNTLKVLKSYTSQTIENDKRVLANFEILSDKDKSKKSYDVQVNGFYQLLSKPVVYESFILQDEETRRDSIGNDPFIYIQAGFGGGFINIDFGIWYSPYSSVKHLINLVYDDTRADADTIYLTLRQNAYGEVQEGSYHLQKGVGRSSFKLADLLPPGVTSKHVQITWDEYLYFNETRTRSASGIFRLNDSPDKTIRLTGQVGFDSSIEIK